MNRRRGGRRAIRAFERELARSDPRLVALFATFTGLARDETMPGTEKLTAWPSRPRKRAGRHRDREGWRATLRSILYGPLTLMAALGFVRGATTASSTRR